MTQPNAQTLILEKDIGLLREDHRKMNERFDRHLEIYANNGKELAALKTVIASLEKTIDARFVSIDKDQTSQWQSIQTTDKNVNTLNIAVNGLAMKIAIFATIGSTAASAIVVFLIERIL